MKRKQKEKLKKERGKRGRRLFQILGEEVRLEGVDSSDAPDL